MDFYRKIFFCFLFFIFSLFNSFSQERAKPKNGDGVTTFLQRYNRNSSVYRKEFIELNKGKFGKNNSLILGVSYKLPPLKSNSSQTKSVVRSDSRTSKIGKEPLLGKKYAKYQLVSQELVGASFYLVSGHGGPDPGAIGRLQGHRLHEDEYAYDIVLRLARNLLSRGAKVEIIIRDAKDGIRDELFLNNSKRETCMGSKIPLNQVARLKQRCDKINLLTAKDKSKYKRSIFIHVDSRGRNNRTDVYFYHSENKYSKRLARGLKTTFEQKYNRHQPGRGFSGTVGYRGLYVIRNVNIPVVFIELGNIQNNFDQKRLIHSNNRQALANWLCEGIVRDYKKK